MANKKRGPKVDYGQVLMWTAVIVSMPRWAGAFIAADAHTLPSWVDAALNFMSILSGFGMGVLEVVATAYMLDAWGRMKPRKVWNAKSLDHRWKVLTGFIVGLFVLMPFILAPYLVSRMNGQTIEQALGGSVWLSYVWSVAVVLSPAFIVGGVAFAQDGHLMPAQSGSQRAESEDKPAQSGAKPAKSKAVPAPEPPEPEEEWHQCPHCPRKFGSQEALNAHQRWCERKNASKEPALYLNGAHK